MDPSTYEPVYDTGVVENILDPETRELKTVPINPAYCLTLESARELAALFDPNSTPLKPNVVMLPPIPQAPASPFTFNHPVPWLRFAGGIVRNAGQLAGYWNMPGVPKTLALEYAILDVQTPVGV